MHRGTLQQSRGRYVHVDGGEARRGHGGEGERREALEARDARRQVRRHAGLEARVGAVDAGDVARRLGGALGETVLEPGEDAGVAGDGDGQLGTLNVLKVLDRHLEDVGLFELGVTRGLQEHEERKNVINRVP